MPLEILDTDFVKAEYIMQKACVHGPFLRQEIAEAIAMERREARRAHEQTND